MNQSTLIFGTLLFGFLMFITVKGQLPEYLSVVGLR